MNKKILPFFFGLLLFLSPFYECAFWNEIDITVSPVRYELAWDKGSSIVKTIKVINNSWEDTTLYINSKDCNTFNSAWNPKCFSPSQNTDMTRTLAPWISSFPETINIPSQSEEDIKFTINIPNNANPWWHYGALFFSYGNKSTANSTINTLKEIWVLLLLNVNGDVDIKWEIKDVSININGWWDNNISLKEDSLKEKLLNFINTNFANLFKQKNVSNINKDKNEDIAIDFWITFENKWNTHIKPKWKITIHDEDGNIIKRVGEETIKNEDGIIIGKKIVDYIPINDEDGNVLPWSERIFSQNWKGFPYKLTDENGENTIKYKSFSYYYTEKNLKDKNILMMWEQIKEREKTEKMKADININYKWDDNKDINFNSAKDFNVTYTEQYVGINWLVVWPAILIWFFFFIIFIIKKRRKKKEKMIEKKENLKKKNIKTKKKSKI